MNSRQMVNDFHVLSCRMKNLHHLLIDHELEKGCEVEARRQAVNQDLGALSGQLDEAELRPEGLLAHEFGVHRHKGGASEPCAGLGQFFGTRDDMHGMRI